MQYFTLIIAAAALAPRVDCSPDLSNSDHLKRLGEGRIFTTDGTEIRHVRLREVKQAGIVYAKNESLHDMAVDKIRYLEFPDTEWGFVKIIFSEKKADIFIYATTK